MAELDLQALQQTVNWVLNIITIILAIIAASLSVRKKQYIILSVVILSIILSLFVIPIIIEWIILIACMIWVGMSKPQIKQDLKASKPSGKKR